MLISVRFAGTLRQLAGAPAVSVPLAEGGTLRDLARALAPLVAPTFAEQVLAPLAAARGSGGALALLLLNRVHLADAGQLDVALRDTDQVVFVPPMEGG